MNGFGKELKEITGAVIPIVLVVVVLQFTVLHMPTGTLGRFLAGAVLVVLGLAVFLQGVKIGLLPLGSAIGSKLPELGSVVLALGIAFVISFVATVAEPDVRVLSGQVELVSAGEISRTTLVLSVSFGVAVFTALAMLRILLKVPMVYLLAGGYGVVLILSFFTPSSFLSLSLDAGSVTTGTMSVPFILSLGVGFSTVLGGRSFADKFGFIGLASIGPIISLMVLGMAYG